VLALWYCWDSEVREAGNEREKEHMQDLGRETFWNVINMQELAG
jgi:hypothetical protein